MSDKQESSFETWFQKGKNKAFAVVAGTLVVLGSALGVQALADGKAVAHLKLYASGADGGGWHGPGWRGGHRGGLAAMSEADIEAKIDRMVKHVAIEIDASADQQAKIEALMTAVAKDLKPVRAQMREAGQEIHELMVADTIDRDALEALRVRRLAEADRISKSVIAALADVAEVLSADQRRLLDKRIGQFRSMRRGWHGNE